MAIPSMQGGQLGEQPVMGRGASQRDIIKELQEKFDMQWSSLSKIFPAADMGMRYVSKQGTFSIMKTTTINVSKGGQTRRLIMTAAAAQAAVRQGGTVTKQGGKLICKTPKALPMVGLGIGVAFGARRWSQGHKKLALLEVLSGALSCLPGIGTGASMAVDGIIVWTEYSKENQQLLTPAYEILGFDIVKNSRPSKAEVNRVYVEMVAAIERQQGASVRYSDDMVNDTLMKLATIKQFIDDNG